MPQNMNCWKENLTLALLFIKLWLCLKNNDCKNPPFIKINLLKSKKGCLFSSLNILLHIAGQINQSLILLILYYLLWIIIIMRSIQDTCHENLKINKLLCLKEINIVWYIKTAEFHWIKFVKKEIRFAAT